MEQRQERYANKNSNLAAKIVILDQKYLKQHLIYNPDTGQVFRRRSGKLITSIHSGGHLQINLNKGAVKLLHRVIWCYMTGEWPVSQIDHIDGNPKNNKWSNLRLATNTQNSRNSGKPKNNTSGFKGVSFVSRLNKYRATIMVNRKSIHLGCFSDVKDAALAYNEAAKSYFGEFALLNTI